MTLGVLFGFYRTWRRRRRGGRRTRVFFVFGMTSISVMYYTFITVVVAFREVFLWEILLLTTMFVAMIYFIIQARRDPGIVIPESTLSGPTRRRLYSGSEENANLSEFEVMWVDSRPIQSKFCVYLLDMQ